MSKKLLSFLTILFFSFSLPLLAEGDGDESVTDTIKVEKAGTLSQIVKNMQKATPLKGSLAITGRMNASDFYFLREQNLTNLDLSQVEIEAGGSFKDIYTEKDVAGKANEIPDYFLFVLYKDNPDMRAPLGGTLKKITFPEGLIKIGQRAFQNSVLKDIEFNEELSVIGPLAFGYCKNIEEIEFESQIDSIGDSAFDGCENLSNIELPESLKFLGGSAFQGCKALESINLPNQLTTIGNNAFKGCESLGEVGIKTMSRISSVGSGAFEGCKSLTALLFGSCIRTIGPAAFQGCTSLQSIDIPSPMLREIPDECFMQDSSLTYFQVPSNVQKIGVQAFNFCKDLKQVVFSKNLKSIGNYAFANSGIENAILPNTLKEIGTAAFKCPELKYVQLPRGIEKLGNKVFGDGDKITYVLITASEPPVFTKDSKAEGLDNLKSKTLYVPQGSVDKYKNAEIWKGFTDIREDKLYTLKSGQKLEDILQGASAEAVGRLKFVGEITEDTFDVFIALSRLYDLDLSEATMSEEDDQSSPANLLMGRSSFDEGDYGDDEQIMEMISRLQRYVFSPGTTMDEADDEMNINAKELREIVVAEGPEKIGENFFEGMCSLQKINIPSTVTEIGSSAFARCSSLDSIAFPKAIVLVPDMVCAFDLALKKVVFSPQTAEIGEAAFAFCGNLEELNLPSNINEIKEQAFFGCFGLKKITFLREISEDNEIAVCGDDAFGYLNTADIELYVPEKSVEAYKADKTWGKFKIIGVNITSAEAAKALKSRAYATEGKIIIENGEEAPIEVAAYTLQGTLCHRGIADCGTTAIKVDPGFYIVKLGRKAVKLIVK